MPGVGVTGISRSLKVVPRSWAVPTPSCHSHRFPRNVQTIHQASPLQTPPENELWPADSDLKRRVWYERHGAMPLLRLRL